MVGNEEIAMKKVLLAALMAGVASSAMAADLPTRKAPPAPQVYAPPVFSWTGFYVGVNGGWGGGTGGKDFGNVSGGLVGGTVGYNYQISQFVIGVEGDWDWADLTKNGTNNTLGYKNKIDDLVTVRARAGYAFDRALLYITGGYAGADDKISLNIPGGSYSSTDWRSGGVIGGGLEYAFTNNISAKAEYLYVPLGSQTFTDSTYSAKSDLNLSIVRAGLNYKF
jgi:outer membrane immunogenic protein